MTKQDPMAAVSVGRILGDTSGLLISMLLD